MKTHMKVVGMTSDHPRAYDRLVAASATDEGQTGVAIDWEKRSLKDFADVPISTLAKAYDLIILDRPHVGQIAKSGCLRPRPRWQLLFRWVDQLTRIDLPVFVGIGACRAIPGGAAIGVSALHSQSMTATQLVSKELS